jgi:hypothetical protein
MTSLKKVLILGLVPDLPSIVYLRKNAFKLDLGIYDVPNFEDVAADLFVNYYGKSL